MEVSTEPENEHLTELGSLPRKAAEALALASETLTHFEVALDLTAIPSDALFANSVGGVACFAVAHRQMRAALLLLHFGAYEAVPPVLRLAFEAAECGQYLAKDPPAADRWFERPTSWPSKPVRSRLGDHTRQEPYGRHYGTLSELSHPTARAGMWAIRLEEDVLRPSAPRTSPDPEQLRSSRCFWRLQQSSPALPSSTRTRKAPRNLPGGRP